MIPKASPPPFPSSALSKVSCQGGKKQIYDFYKKSKNKRTRGLEKWSLAKKYEKYENYSGRFPEGVHKEEIQQWRLARSRPGEKETLNIMLREKW